MALKAFGPILPIVALLACAASSSAQPVASPLDDRLFAFVQTAVTASGARGATHDEMLTALGDNTDGRSGCVVADHFGSSDLNNAVDVHFGPETSPDAAAARFMLSEAR